jgi:hypothetical protein
VRRALLAAIALVVGAATACSGGDDGDAAPSTTRPASTAREATTTTAEATTTTADPDVVAVVDLAVGDCFDEASAIREVRIVDCAGQHRNEVYAMALYESGGARYPGDEPLAGFAQERCVDDFAAYVGQPVEATAYGIGTMYPDQDSWRTGDREVLCVLFHQDGRPVEGSAAAEGG